jgi:putative transposase
MKKSKFNATQVAAILKEFDNGKPIEDISREYGVSRAIYFINGASDMEEWKRVN